MEVGTGLFTCQRRPDDDRDVATLYDEMGRLAGVADDAGLASVWVSEHHFTDDGYLSGTTPSLGALAARTSDVTVGTCIAQAPFYDGVRLAEDAATVDLLSDGRLALGLSIGYRDAEFENFGVPKDERTDRIEDLVPLLRGAWSPGPLGYDSEFHAVSPDATVTPTPAGDPPILLGGAAKPAVRRAARIADGWIAPSSLSVDGIEKRVADVERVREEDAIDGDFQVYVIQHGFVADSDAAAWERMRDGYLYLQRRYAEWYADGDFDGLDDDRRAELKEQAIFGPPADVAAELDRYREALGDDVHFIFRTYYPGLDADAMAECVRRLGDEVVPAV